MQTSRSFFRSPFFWIVFTILSVAAGVASIIYFPQAMPLLDITITMNKQQALEQANRIAEKYALGPTDAQQVAYFNNDQNVQNYIELHAGGSKAFQQLLQEQFYFPYKWQVRHFKEGVQNEATFIFTPTGQPYGFSEIIPENSPGAKLSSEQAQEKAEQFMRQWGINLDVYKLIESSHENRISGRRDHTLVYQRIDRQIKDAHYRITVGISGDKIATLNHFIEIPEFFSRSYQEMRAANQTIASFAQAALYILYFFGGCFLGILFLIRRRALWSKPALLMGLAIALCQLFVVLNQASLIWFCYDTAVSIRTFWIQYIIELVSQFGLWVLLYSTTFMVAEGLTRQAFGSRIQLWRLWETSVASSYTVLAKTLLGYLIIGFDLAFVVFFYTIGTRFCGWWSPASALIDPNILSTYSPGLGVLARAVTAGFWEECLFRAVPLALSALIGKKLGSRKCGIIVGFILQAVIFGAAHANYATQPAYVRVIELILPSFVFGGLYLAFGLLPGIIAHTVYDAILFSLPLFVSTAPGVGWQKALVLIGILLPLLVVFFNRLRAKRWLELPQNAYNSSWHLGREQAPQRLPRLNLVSAEHTLSSYNLKIMIILGILSLGVFTLLQFKTKLLPVISITKETAITKAQEALQADGTLLNSQWRVGVTLYPFSSFDSQHLSDLQTSEKFIWYQNQELYFKFLGSYLAVPQWHVRFARFTGDIAARAEEYHIYVDSQGTIARFHHQLPETAPGKTLSEQKARNKALNFIKNKFSLDSSRLQEVSASGTKQPERQDWIFTFAQKEPELTQGQARIAITLAGDQITDSSRFIYVPEEWLREQKKQEPLESAFSFIGSLCFFIVVALASILALSAWQSGQFAVTKALIYSLILGSLSLGKMLSALPELLASLSTSQPISAQLSLYFTSYAVQLLLQLLLCFLLSGVLFSFPFERFKISKISRIVLGISIGCFMSGILTFLQKFFLITFPLWHSFEGASSAVPWLTCIATFTWQYSNRALALVILALYAHITNYRLVALALCFVAAGILVPGSNDISPSGWILCFVFIVLAIQLLYKNFIQFDPLLIPSATATVMILNLIVQLQTHAYPGSTINITLALLSLTGMALFLSRLRQP